MSPPPLEIVLPDWSALDTVTRSPLPFGLWTIGDQCLLHHWLDHAVNQGKTSVRVFTADRPAAVRKILEQSTLWPLETELIAIPSTADAPASAIHAGWLPGEIPPPFPANGWELAAHASAMERAWLDRMAGEPDYAIINTGFACRIHPEATLTPPYFIGDHVFIGPGCEVGPYAVIGGGSVISGANVIKHSHLSDHSFVGPVTALEHCRLEHGVVLNLKNRVRLENLEEHLVSTLEKTPPTVPLRDKIRALALYLRFRRVEGNSSEFETFNGITLTGNPEAADLAHRISWLPLVWQGKMALYGVLPRTQEQLLALDPDWQTVVRHSPIGVFSYADTQDCHSPSHPDEALHAVYQASLPPNALVPGIREFTRTLKPADLLRPNRQP